MKKIVVALLALVVAIPAAAKRNEAATDEDPLAASSFAGLALRSIGPALASGRISDLAVLPDDPDTWYVAVASGGVWKTTNAGTTFEPIFDDQGSYSIGCVTVDPNDSNVVWVGTGENNSQRSVSYGDGVYKSLDGGATWTNTGLEESEHVGEILVDPTDSDTVYVAAQGPLWSSGGDRGLYKTTDGGETWARILEISPDTGVTDVAFAPGDPDTLYAASYQRRRRVWTLVNGGPESGFYKSTDGGETWREIEAGLPSVDIGRIGLAVAPSDPDLVYAIVEAQGDEGGFFRSVDRGERWEKRSDYVSGSPQYYQEIVVDPRDASRIYSNDTWMQVSEDGGETWSAVGEKAKHVDNHALWIDPEDTDHILAGCDGGIYETWDRGATWHFKPNLPVTQFYRVAVDDDMPFYNVYGGTQDNFTQGGPSRTPSANGITNRDWFVVVGGDGFEPAVDSENPDIVYGQWQYGNLVRHDRASGEIIDIQPQPEAGEILKWNWDSPLMVSPHSHTRLYFGANKLFRSDDRGGSWTKISGDLTRQIDRNELEVMGKVWGVDAVSKNRSTSFFGNLVSLTESPLVEGLLYAGTDDGLIQISEDGGQSWRAVKSEELPGVPEMTYVADLEASRVDPDTVYVAFDAHKDGDFRPYVLKSTDRGSSWTSIAGDLPERGTVYTLVQDHVNPDLLFVGTEYGIWFTPDEGSKWIELAGGMPTIAVRDLEIQRRAEDLVAATFGRGFYILDDYTPLRDVSPVTEERSAVYPVEDPLMYVEAVPLGLPDKSFQGDSFYVAENPPLGAVVTYYLPETIETLEEERKEREKAIDEEGGALFYPKWEELEAEDREEDPAVIVTVTDEEGEVVRRLTGPVSAGFHRIAWDLRYPPFTPVSLDPPSDNPFASPDRGPLATPGGYTVSLATRVRGEATPFGEPRSFEARPLGMTTVPAEDREALLAFQKETGDLQRAALGSARAIDEAQTRIDHLERAILDTPDADLALRSELREIELRLLDLEKELLGDRTVASRSEPTTPSIVDRVQQVVSGHWGTTSAPTETHRRNQAVAGEQLGEWLPKLRTVIETDLAGLEERLEELGAPWTPGRVPVWPAK